MTDVIDLLAYEMWAVTLKEVDDCWDDRYPMPDDYKGGKRAYYYAIKMRQLFNLEYDHLIKKHLEEQIELAKESAIAWNVLQSLHRDFCKKTDALYSTRQQDFIKDKEKALEKLNDLLAQQERING